MVNILRVYWVDGFSKADACPHDKGVWYESSYVSFNEISYYCLKKIKKKVAPTKEIYRRFFFFLDIKNDLACGVYLEVWRTRVIRV